MPPLIQFHGVHRQFQGRPVLSGLDLEVRPGEIFALLGRNGAGKTTAIRILLGFLRPMRGHAEILGVNGAALTPADRDRIGYISEGQRLDVSMKIRDALAFEAGTRPRFRRSHAERSLQRLGLNPAQGIAKLSRGQRAQLALVFAAAGEPEVLVFDDPAMGLDVVMRRELLDVMIDLFSDAGCAVLFSSHILTDVERVADRVGILHDGQLLVDAPLDELKRRVQRRFWTPLNGRTVPQESHGTILRRRPRQGGLELTLLDCGPEQESWLRAQGGELSEPQGLNLEELFVDLTTREEA